MGKTYINPKGYKVYKDSGTPVHRAVAANKLGRPLRKEERVHHKDRNKLNNDPRNLHVFSSQKAHDAIHKMDAKKFGKKASYNGY